MLSAIFEVFINNFIFVTVYIAAFNEFLFDYFINVLI